jgi:lysophospholipase L1-like esterase
MAALVAGLVLVMTGCDTGRTPALAPASPSVSATPSPRPTSAAALPWVGTWSAAVQSGAGTLRGRTLRQIVRTSIGGAVARVRLSNRYGTGPLTVRSVRLARPVEGPTVAEGSDRAVTFGGAAEVTLPAGGAAESDPVDFPVPAVGGVAISFFLPDATGPATVHSLANRNNYVVTGEHSADVTLTGARPTSSYFFLAGLDVRNERAAGALVAFGASITDGYHSTFGADRRWPDLLAERLHNGGRTVAVLNAGISGNKLLSDAAGAGESALARFDRDVLAQPGARWVVISDDPLNDLGSADPPSGAELTAGLAQLVGRGRAAGLTVYCSTLTPFQGASHWQPRAEQERTTFNAYVRGPGHCDGVVDQDAVTHDQAAPTRYRPGFDAGDHLHPNDRGMAAIAGAVADVMD